MKSLFFLVIRTVAALGAGQLRGERPLELDAAASRALDPAHIRAVVVERGETDPVALNAVRSLGANTLITRAQPDPATSAAAREAGLFYVARMSTQEAARAGSDPLYAGKLRSVEGVAGIYYEDDEAEEGYASPQSQQSTYASLKGLFPGALILHPTRLVSVASDPTFLDEYFRPLFTDLVTPYFYPVGATALGTFAETDDWDTLLESLLRAVAGRMAPGQGVLPVLQGFERYGSMVDRQFPLLQMEAYTRVWPDNRNAAVFAWTTATPEPLAPLVELLQLQRGVCDLFTRLSPLPARCRGATVILRQPGP